LTYVRVFGGDCTENAKNKEYAAARFVPMRKDFVCTATGCLWRTSMLRAFLQGKSSVLRIVGTRWDI
jgi:hypothetical protein